MDHAAIRDPHVRAATAFFFVFSAVDRASLDSIAHWYRQVMAAQSVDRCPCVLVANKCDLAANDDILLSGEELAVSLQTPYVRVSAKTGEGVDACMQAVLNRIQSCSSGFTPREVWLFQKLCGVCFRRGGIAIDACHGE